MSLTDKVANGLAVVFIQKQVPCLKLYGVPDYDDTLTTLPVECSPAPTEIPDTHSTCFTFYQSVLFYSTGGSAVFGAFFVMVMIMLGVFRRKSNSKNIV